MPAWRARISKYLPRSSRRLPTTGTGTSILQMARLVTAISPNTSAAGDPSRSPNPCSQHAKEEFNGRRATQPAEHSDAAQWHQLL